MTKKKKDDDMLVLFTPICRSKWNHLNEPDEYKGQKNFKTELVMDDDQLDEFGREKIEEAIDAFYEETKADLEESLKGRKLKKALDELDKAYPWTEEEDEDGEETGDYIVRFKSGPNKKGKRRFPIVDAQGEKTDVLVFGGSKLRVKTYVKPYYMGSTGKVGVTLYIQGVQVVELAGGDGADQDPGFGAVEGGWTDDGSHSDDMDDNDDADDEDDEGHDDF